MQVDVVATDGVLWQGEATSVVVPAWDGEMGILPGREPVLAVLRAGTVRVTIEAGDTSTIDVLQGFVSVDSDVVTVVVNNDEEAEPLLDEHAGVDSE